MYLIHISQYQYIKNNRHFEQKEIYVTKKFHFLLFLANFSSIFEKYDKHISRYKEIAIYSQLGHNRCMQRRPPIDILKKGRAWEKKCVLYMHVL